MQMVLSEGYRGLGVVFDLALDRVLVPVAVLVAVAGAAVIGVQLAEIVGPSSVLPYAL